MTAFPSQDYRDPLEILLAREARTCRGCIYQHTERAFGTDVTICTRKNDNGTRRQHGRRCKDYREDER